MASPTLFGADTSLLVAHSVVEHPDHEAVSQLTQQIIGAGSLITICPTVIDEFIHLVTDSRRFERPLDMVRAVNLAQTWCESKETLLLSPSDQSIRRQLEWLQQFRLGRKRIHDTQIASIYSLSGVKKMISSNWRDFTVFDCFEVVWV